MATPGEKTSAKSSVQPPRPRRALVPQPHGGALLPGGTGAPGTGRPPDWLKRQADDLLAHPESWSQVEAILKDKSHAMFGVMWGKLADRAHGKPKESVDVKLDGNITITQQWTFGGKKVGF